MAHPSPQDWPGPPLAIAVVMAELVAIAAISVAVHGTAVPAVAKVMLGGGFLLAVGVSVGRT